MPYRIDILRPPPDALDLLVQLGALDVEPSGDSLAALFPDAVTADAVSKALGGARVTVSAAAGRDSESVWLLTPREVRIGSLRIAPAHAAASSNVIRLADSKAFGTGHHPTTALCVEAIEEILAVERVESILDVGTGSGILAIAALILGVPQAVGLDIDEEALEAAAENARLNQVAHRLQLVAGGPDSVDGQWPLVVANIVAAPLIGMAPVLARRLGRRGRLVLSGIPRSLESEVRRAYEHLGIGHTGSRERGGWVALTAVASW